MITILSYTRPDNNIQSATHPHPVGYPATPHLHPRKDRLYATARNSIGTLIKKLSVPRFKADNNGPRSPIENRRDSSFATGGERILKLYDWWNNHHHLFR